ncbi:unnamed protein product, partial [Hapterophycus canaliculatus]
MGFTEARARQGLAKHKDVQAAVEWLSSGGGDGDPAEQRYVLCEEDEARLLAGAGASLVSEASLSDQSWSETGAGANKTGVEQAGARAVAGTREDDGRVLRALRSSGLQSALNVTTMHDELLPDLVGQTLPAEWRGAGGSKTAFPWTPGKGGHPDVDWFRRLWGYLASTRPSAVRLLAESFPVVPTGNGVVCPLSLTSAVIDGGKLGEDVRSILVKASCRTLLPGVFSGGQDESPTLTAPLPPPPAEKESKAAPATAGGAVAQDGNAASGASPKRSLPPAPAELFQYVRPGTRGGVLAALGTARRSAGKPLTELMRAALPSERDALRDFLAREPASEITQVELDVCRALPILPLYEDGLAAARALARAATASGGSGPPTPRQGSGGAYAAAGSAPLYLLLEKGTGFVGVDSDGRDGGGSGASGPVAEVAGATQASPQKWLEAHLFTPSFVRVGGSGTGRKGAAEAALLERLGVKLVGRAVFFVDHVFPRVEELPGGLRDAAMVEALLAAPRLSQQHERFRSALTELEFVPTSGKANTLVRPRQTFDPEVPELPALLPESKFPGGVFRHKDVLAALRPLGLQGALDWPGLVEAAASVEAMARSEPGLGRKGAGGGRLKEGSGGGGGGDLGKGRARVRGRALLTYLDTHEQRLFELKKDSGQGLFQRMAKLVYSDPAAEERARQRLAALHRLMSLSWVPVLDSFPSPLVPPTVDGDARDGGGSGAAGTADSGRDSNSGVVSPSRVRSREDMWLSSRTFYVLDAEVRYTTLRSS